MAKLLNLSEVFERIELDLSALDQATSPDPFYSAADDLLKRAAGLASMLVAFTGESAENKILDRDQAVIGGLLVRASKLYPALREAASSESETHHILARCIVETMINLRYLVAKDDPTLFERFVADSYAPQLHWKRRVADQNAAAGRTDDFLYEQAAGFIDQGLSIAGVDESAVPSAPQSWAGNLRQRFEFLGLDGWYGTLFAMPANYVHGTWHEISTFHVRTVDGGFELDATFGGITPNALYSTCDITFGGLLAYLEYMPTFGLERDDARAFVERTVNATKQLNYAFAGFIERGGIGYNEWTENAA